MLCFLPFHITLFNCLAVTQALRFNSPEVVLSLIRVNRGFLHRRVSSNEHGSHPSHGIVFAS